MLGRVAMMSGALSRLLDYLAVFTRAARRDGFLTGGFREWMPWGRVSVTSWVRPLVIAWSCRRCGIGCSHSQASSARLNAWRARSRGTTRCVRRCPSCCRTRARRALVGFLAVVLFGYRADVPVPWRIYENEFLNLPARWDTGWYMGVATDGYQWMPARSGIQQNIAFFPAYPLLMRYGSLFFGREMMWTGVLISWVSFFGALVYLYRFARERFDADASRAASRRCSRVIPSRCSSAPPIPSRSFC